MSDTRSTRRARLKKWTKSRDPESDLSAVPRLQLWSTSIFRRLLKPRQRNLERRANLVEMISSENITDLFSERRGACPSAEGELQSECDLTGEALTRSEEHFRSLIEHGTDVITIVDSKGTIVYASPSIERVLGRTPQSLFGLNKLSLIHPADREAASTLIDRAIREGLPVGPAELRFEHSDGSWRILEAVGQCIRDESAETEIIINSRDITERKHSEEALRESEEKYRTILENIQEGYYECDLRGHLTFFNSSLPRIVGTPPEKMLGLSPRAYTDPATASLLFEKFAEVYRTGKPVKSFQYEITTLEGLEKVLETSVLIRCDSSGQIVGFQGTLRDVTAHVRAEQALRESEERYKTLFESATDAIMILDAGEGRVGRIVEANRAAAEHTGYSVEELLRLSVSDLQPQERAEQTSRDNESIASGEKLCIELMRRRKDGSMFPVEVNASPLSIGGEQYILSFARDLTQRKQIEHEVAMLAHAVRSIQECVSITDTNNIVMFVNDAFLNTYGFDRSDVIGKSIVDLVRVDESELGDDPLRAAALSQPWEGELLNRKKDGTVFPIHLCISPIHDDTGRTIALAGVAQDITERKSIEKEISMLAHAMQSVGEFIVITDLDGDILFVNDSALARYGYQRNELVGSHVSRLHARQAKADLINEVRDSGKTSVWSGELLSRQKDGAEFPISLSISQIEDEQRRSVALVGISQDITERKLAIEELREAKEAAEAANRAKSEFLANMSHEIRTPMNGIIGMTELALDTELTLEQREYLKLVKLSADSLLGVINDILDFSKIEAGKMELEMEEFNLPDAIDDVMKALGVRAEQKGLELAYYLRPGVPEVVVGDLGRLRQVLVNLVGNAIKFTDRGEVIVRVELEAHTDDELILHFGIRDTGIGIPLAKQKMIFESFTQADGSTTRKYGGTGLGLAISAQLTHLMGGSIWVESPVDLPGRKATPGSMFHVTARFGRPQQAIPASQTPQAALAGLPVLVVDDNATNRRILEVQLTNWNMNPVAVDGAVSAFKALADAEAQGSPFKLILMDFHMPETDGLELTEQIKTRAGSEQLKIIMMSSSVHQNQARQKLVGVNAGLVKPVKAAELLGVIRTVLGAEQPVAVEPRRTRLTTSFPSRILVAEDSLVNQALIKLLLEKWGHLPCIAENGAETLALLESEQFDMILMDLQMPELNGFEATSAIRNKEYDTDKHIPIIALTAHALKGDRERCIEAGMDDYVSKPIEPQLLFDVVERAAAKAVPVFKQEDFDRRVLDFDSLIRNFEGDVDLLRMLGRVFVDTSQQQMSVLVEAFERGDAEALARDAHAIRGSVANFRADAAVSAAVRLEQIARDGDLSLAGSALARLESEICRVVEDFQAFEQASLI
jgi:two-component system, sensor histidine kinase and response regulator